MFLRHGIVIFVVIVCDATRICINCPSIIHQSYLWFIPGHSCLFVLRRRRIIRIIREIRCRLTPSAIRPTIPWFLCSLDIEFAIFVVIVCDATRIRINCPSIIHQSYLWFIHGHSCLFVLRRRRIIRIMDNIGGVSEAKMKILGFSFCASLNLHYLCAMKTIRP